MLRFYYPQLLSPFLQSCVQENAKINFGTKETRSTPASQTLKYKPHTTLRNKDSHQNNYIACILFQTFIIYGVLNFTGQTFRKVEFPI